MPRAPDAPPPEPPPRSNPGYQYSPPRAGRMKVVLPDGTNGEGPWVVELDAGGIVYLDSFGKNPIER